MRKLAHAIAGCAAVVVAGAALVGCGENLTPTGGVDAGPVSACIPNLDGVIDPGEFPSLAAVSGAVLLSPPGMPLAVDVRGAVDAEGHRIWDLTDDAPGTTRDAFAARPVSSQWYASRFPAAEFAFRGSDGALDLVYSQTQDALRLHGFASAIEDPPSGQTLVAYATAVEVFRFPMTRDDTWTAIADIAGGIFNGAVFTGRDTYVVSDDATGRVDLPDLSVTQAHRVRLSITSQPAIGPSMIRRQVSFLFECFGEIARATSRLDETAEDFTTASELRRFALGR